MTHKFSEIVTKLHKLSHLQSGLSRFFVKICQVGIQEDGRSPCADRAMAGRRPFSGRDRGLVGSNELTVYKWLRRYEDSGLDGLTDLARPGRPRGIPQQVRSRSSQRR